MACLQWNGQIELAYTYISYSYITSATLRECDINVITRDPGRSPWSSVITMMSYECLCHNWLLSYHFDPG